MCPIQVVTLYGWSYSIWVVHDVPNTDGNSIWVVLLYMGGPWCVPIDNVNLWVVLLYMGGPWCVPIDNVNLWGPVVCGNGAGRPM